MVKKLLLGLGVVVLAIGGPVVAWQFVDDDRRAGAIGEETEEGVQGAIRWRGEFDKEVVYQPLDVVSFGGSSYVATKEIQEAAPPDEPWDLLAQAGAEGAQGAQGGQGVAGTFTGTFRSPDGRYQLSVTNAGIEATGPDHGTVRMDSAGITVRSDYHIGVIAGGNLELRAQASTMLRGGVVQLNCSGNSSGSSVARIGSPVQVSGSSGVVQQGSPTVLTC